MSEEAYNVEIEESGNESQNPEKDLSTKQSNVEDEDWLFSKVQDTSHKQKMGIWEGGIKENRRIGEVGIKEVETYQGIVQTHKYW